MTKTDRIIGLIIMLLSIGMFYSAITMQHPQFDRDPGPSFIPMIYAIALFICTVGLVFFPRIKNEKKKENNDEEVSQMFKENTVKMIVLFISLIIYTALFKPLGFALSSLLFLMFAFYYLAPERSIKLIVNSFIISIIVIAAVYYVLKVQLNIQLPSGIFF